MIIKYDETCSGATLTANSESINYLVTNILDSRLTKKFRTSASTTATIVFDCGAAVAAETIAIANHNISSGVTTLKIQGNATDSWGAPSVDETITWASGIITHDFTQATYRYWRVQIIDAGNSDGYIELGRVYIGNNETVPDIAPNFSATRPSATVKSKSGGGQTYGDIRHKKWNISVQWPKITHAQKATLVTFFDAIDISNPFFIVFDETDLDFTNLYVTIDQNSLNFQLLIDPDYYRGALSIEEEK